MESESFTLGCSVNFDQLRPMLWGIFFYFIFLIGKKKYNKRSAKKHKQPKVTKKQQLYTRKK